MSNNLLEPQSLDTNKYILIPMRLEDLVNLWRDLNASILESLNAFSTFQNSLYQSSRTLGSSLNSSDHSFINKLIQQFLYSQEEVPDKSIEELIIAFSKSNQTFDSSLQQTITQATHLASESSIQTSSAYQNYQSRKINYEYACRQAEALIAEKKKRMSDPVIYYDASQHGKIREKINQALTRLRDAEGQILETVGVYNEKQQTLNMSLGTTMRMFKETINSFLNHVNSNMKRHHLIFQRILKSESQRQQLVWHDNISLNLMESDYKYLETKGRENDQPEFGGFLDFQNRFIESNGKGTAEELLQYHDQFQNFLKATTVVSQDRQRAMTNLNGYLQNFYLLSMTIETTFRRLAANTLSQTGISLFTKQVGKVADPFYEGFEALAIVFQNFSTFLNQKISAVNEVFQAQRTQSEEFYQTLSHMNYDFSLLKELFLSLQFQEAKLEEKIIEALAVNETDDQIKIRQTQLMQIAEEKDNTFARFRKQAGDIAEKIVTQSEENRKQEAARLSNLSSFLKEVSEQRIKLFESLQETVTQMKNSMKSQEEIDLEVRKALEEDYVLSEYVKELESGSSHRNTLAKDLVFERLYTPPYDASDFKTRAIGRKSTGAKPETERCSETSPRESELRFGFKETPVDDFACALEYGVPRQGRLYIYPKAVCFSTMASSFGGHTLVIPIEDIQRVEKRTISLVFDTALTLITKQGEIKFISFFHRDKAFNLIHDQIQTDHADEDSKSLGGDSYLEDAKKESERTTQSMNTLESSKRAEFRKSSFAPITQEASGEWSTRSTELLRSLKNEGEANKASYFSKESQIIPQQQIAELSFINEVVRQRKLRIRSLVFQDEEVPTELVRELFDCSAMEIFFVAFSDTQILHKEKEYESAWAAAKVEAGDTDLRTTQWSPSTPFEDPYEEDSQNFQFMKRVAEWEDQSQRKFSYTHPVREGGILFPKTCPVEESHSGFWLGPDEFIVQNEISISNIPMSDCFVVKNRFQVRDLPSGKCELIWRFGVNFVKSTVFKGKISNSSRDENTEFAKNIFIPIIHEQLGRHLEKKAQVLLLRNPLKDTIQNERTSFEESQTEFIERSQGQEWSFVEKSGEVVKRSVQKLPEEQETITGEVEVTQEFPKARKFAKLEDPGKDDAKRIKEMNSEAQAFELRKRTMKRERMLCLGLIIIIFISHLLIFGLLFSKSGAFEGKSKEI